MLDRRNLFDADDAATPAPAATTVPVDPAPEPTRRTDARRRPHHRPARSHRRARTDTRLRRGRLVGLSLAGCAAWMAAIVLLAGARDQRSPTALPHAHSAPQRPATRTRRPADRGPAGRPARLDTTAGHPRPTRRGEHRHRARPARRPAAPVLAQTPEPAPLPAAPIPAAALERSGPVGGDANFVGGEPAAEASYRRAPKRDRTVIVP